MRLALILLLLPTLSLASLCCQGAFREMQSNATCPTPTLGTNTTRVECAGVCCSSRATGFLNTVVAQCVPNATVWIQSIRAANVASRAAGFDFAYTEDCLLSSSAPATRHSAAYLITLTILLAVLPFV